MSPDLIAPERAVLGSEYFRYRRDGQPTSICCGDNRAELAQIITHPFDVAEIGEAFDTFLAGETGKVVVTQEGA